MAVYRLKKAWRYDFEKAGKRFTKTGFKTKSEAKAAEAKAKEKAELMNLKFGRLCVRRLKNLKINRTKKYLKENQSLFKKLIKRWALKETITREDVQDYLYQIAEKKPQTANKHLRLIKALFQFGVDEEMISSNPCQRIKPFSYSPKRRYVPPEEDLRKVLNQAKGMEKLYILMVFHTLARVREINKLKWIDVYPNFLILRTKKAKNSVETERVVALNSVLKEVIGQLPREGEFVFINPATKKPYDYRSKLMRKLCKKAEVERFNFHALRHFGSSKLAEFGTAITDIQAVLGHSRATTTDIYLRSLKVSTAEAMKGLEGIK